MHSAIKVTLLEIASRPETYIEKSGEYRADVTTEHLAEEPLRELPDGVHLEFHRDGRNATVVAAAWQIDQIRADAWKPPYSDEEIDNAVNYLFKTVSGNDLSTGELALARWINDRMLSGHVPNGTTDEIKRQMRTENLMRI